MGINEKDIDVVGEYIELKQHLKDGSEKLAALELLILESHRNDERIKIQDGRKTYIIKDETYEKLETVGITTTITETRKKDLKEFDKTVQNLILELPDNYEVKTTKEIIKVL